MPPVMSFSPIQGLSHVESLQGQVWIGTMQAHFALRMQQYPTCQDFFAAQFTSPSKGNLHHLNRVVKY